MTDPYFRYRNNLAVIAETDVEQTLEKDAQYNGSWLRRGGVGAFMMMARKWDRIEPAVAAHSYDIFTAHHADRRAEGLLDDIRDLRRYLLLVEAEILVQMNDRKKTPGCHIDNTGQSRPFGFDASVD
jgi:hypothetical protein